MNGRKSKEFRRMKLRHVVPPQYRSATYKSWKFALTHPNASVARPKPLVERKRKPMAPIKATWPRTVNQWAQSRPVIVKQPVKQMLEGRENKVTIRSFRSAGNWVPKNQLDAAALRGYLR